MATIDPAASVAGQQVTAHLSLLQRTDLPGPVREQLARMLSAALQPAPDDTAAQSAA